MSESGRWTRALQVACAAAGLLGGGCGSEDPDSDGATGGIGIGSDATVSGGSTSTGTTSSTSAASSTGNASTTSGTSTTGAGTTTGAGGTGAQVTGAGGSSTGSASTTGGAGFDCLQDGGEVPGEPAPCDFVDESYDCCTRCVTETCCAEFGACFASEPFNVCGGAEDSSGEFAAIQECMVYLPGGAVPSDLENCVGDAIQRVSAPGCGLGAISGPTNELVSCVRGDQDGLGGCFEECFTPFDESGCLF